MTQNNTRNNRGQRNGGNGARKGAKPAERRRIEQVDRTNPVPEAVIIATELIAKHSFRPADMVPDNELFGLGRKILWDIVRDELKGITIHSLMFLVWNGPGNGAAVPQQAFNENLPWFNIRTDNKQLMRKLAHATVIAAIANILDNQVAATRSDEPAGEETDEVEHESTKDVPDTESDDEPEGDIEPALADDVSNDTPDAEVIELHAASA